MPSAAKTYAVIGATEHALALAAELRLAGNRVIVAEQATRRAALDALAAAPGLDVDCQVESVVGGRQRRPVKGIEVAPDVAAAVGAAQVLIFMTPQTAYEDVLAASAGSLRNDQIILLCPGGLGGALLVARIAAKAGAPDLLVAQTSAMPLGGRNAGPAALRIASKKKFLPVGVFPASRTQELLERLAEDFPQLTANADVIETGFAGAAMGLHPIPMIMNAARIEADGPYVYDGYAITPSIARVIDAVDAERQLILKALGAPLTTFSDILKQSYGVDGDSFHEVVHAVPGYKQVKSPPDLRYRYLSEDVPTQLVPAVALARVLGVATPMLVATVNYANAMHGCDYWRSGWNLEKLGLDGLDAAGIAALLARGFGAR
nr:NAD/NADP octopine/nopaline dehydrogenase family protein [Methylobacterium sp. ZNC0032]